MTARESRESRAALLSRLLPDDRPDQLPVQQGQFHTVVIGADRVVRLPRTPAAAARLPGGADALRLLAALDLGVRTPEPLAEGSGEQPYLVLTRLPGEPLPPEALDDDRVAESAAAQVAALLGALSRTGRDGAVRAQLPAAQAPSRRWREFAEGVRAELFPLLSDGGRLRAERELAALDGIPDRTDALVHGDLGPENLLWERAHGLPRLAGVLDWDDVALGDRAEDLAAVGAGYGDGFLRRVLALGGAPDSTLATRVSAIRGTFALQQALCALRDGDTDELADGLAGYR
ncbi:phosphotransferase family protein [Kitasatospora sp. NPDC101183]|uniref:phosphotransferase family protein n=1 Tax=Kitasatospora sp. NPDC101183 TaxID=3364100 RepID=UPI00382B9FDB